MCVCREGVLVLISMYSALSLTLVREQRYVKIIIIIIMMVKAQVLVGNHAISLLCIFCIMCIAVALYR